MPCLSLTISDAKCCSLKLDALKQVSKLSQSFKLLSLPVWKVEFNIKSWQLAIKLQYSGMTLSGPLLHLTFKIWKIKLIYHITITIKIPILFHSSPLSMFSTFLEQDCRLFLSRRLFLILTDRQLISVMGTDVKVINPEENCSSKMSHLSSLLWTLGRLLCWGAPLILYPRLIIKQLATSIGL